MNLNKDIIMICIYNTHGQQSVTGFLVVDDSNSYWVLKESALASLSISASSTKEESGRKIVQVSKPILFVIF
ncbi:hypothetical protein CsSME_00045734 [Camellia sinensis var. sinensis]